MERMRRCRGLQCLVTMVSIVALAVSPLTRLRAAPLFQFDLDAREVLVQIDADPGVYHILDGSEDLESFAALVMQLGSDAPDTLVEPLTPGRDREFFRLRTVDRGSPLDTDTDGLDDIYELERAGLLNPFDSADAASDPDGDGFSWIDDFNNRSPTLEVIGDRDFDLGRSLTIQLAATDLDGDSLAFDASPRPLPAGASLVAETGLFTFQPTAAGAHELTFWVTDGRLFDSETITIDVLPGQPGASTSLSGRLLDTTDFTATGTETPVVGATISLLDTGLSVLSDGNGEFLIADAPSGGQILDIDTSTANAAPDGSAYAGFRERINLIEGVANIFDRPFFMPRLAMDSMAEVNPALTTMVENNDLGAMLEVPPHTAMMGEQEFDGMLSISEVPEALAPAALPEELDFGLLITIQPVGVTFNEPVPLTMPNTDNLPPGTEVDIWSLNPVSGQFYVAGTGRVTPDGSKIETIAGGVRAADWHGMLPLESDCDEDEEDGEDEEDECNPAVGSSVNMFNGSFQTEIQLPLFSLFGVEEDLRLHYNSNRAWVNPVVSFRGTIPVRSAVPGSVTHQMFIADRAGRPIHTRTVGLSESQDETFSLAGDLDAADLPSGNYVHEVSLTANFNRSSVGARFSGKTEVYNLRDSPFGAGWGLRTLQRIYDTEPIGSAVLLTDGDGSAWRFSDFVSLERSSLTIGGFDASRADGFSVIESGGFSELRSALTETVEEVNFVALSELSAPSLADVDVLILHPYKSSTEGNSLSPAEQLALETYVRGGGCALILLEHDLGRASMTAALESLTTPFGVTATSVIGDVLIDDPAIDLITTGEFGTVTSLGRPFGGGALSDLGAFARPLDSDLDGKASLAVIDGDALQPGSGLVAFIPDTQIWLNSGEIGFSSNFSHRALLLNLLQACLLTKRDPNAELLFIGPPGETSEIRVRPDGTMVRLLKDGTRFEFDAQGRQVGRIDRNGNTTTYQYDALSLLETITGPAPASQTVSFAYDGSDRIDTITDPAGRVTQFEHNSVGDLIAVTLPGRGTRRYTYDNRHVMLTETDANGGTVEHAFDRFGMLRQVDLPGGGTIEVEPMMARVLNLPSFAPAGVPPGEPGSETNPAPVVRPGEVAGTFTDGEGRETVFITNAGAQEVRIEDDRFGFEDVTRDEETRPVSLNLNDWRHFSYGYDDDGNQVSRTDVEFPGSITAEFESGSSRMTRLTDALGHTSLFGYDAGGNVTLRTTHEGRSVSRVYNGRGQLMSEDSVTGLQKNWTWNNDGEGTQAESTDGVETRAIVFTHTAAGNLETVTDDFGHQLGIGYDGAGQPDRLTLPGGAIVNAGYDGEGNMTSLTPPGRPTHRMEYTPAGLISAYHPPAAAGSGSSRFFYNLARDLVRIEHPGGIVMTREYAASGLPSRVTIPRGIYDITYDASLRYEGSSSPDGVTTTFGYRGARITDVTTSGAVGGSVSFTHDAAYRRTSSRVNGVDPVLFEYDGDSLPTRGGAMTLVPAPVTGLLASSMLGNLTTTFQYDAWGAVTMQSVTEGVNPVATLGITRDGIGRAAQITETVGGSTTNRTFTWHPTLALETESVDGATTTYLYDPNGNRTSVQPPTGPAVSAAHDDQDRLLSRGGVSYTYDPLGALLSRTDGGQVTDYTYDALGHLVSVALPGGDTISYLVDGQNRRVAKAVNGTRTLAFLYGSDDRPVAQLDATGQVVSRFVFARGRDVPDYMTRGGVDYLLVSDHLQSVRLVVDSTNGQVVQRIDYDAYGRVIADSNPGFQPFGFGGGIYDPDTGLVRFGARDYDAEAGRWTAKDPSSFAGGNSNLYNFVYNDPVNNRDPSGEEIITIIVILISVTTFTVALVDAGERIKESQKAVGEKLLTPKVFSQTTQYASTLAYSDPGFQESFVDLTSKVPTIRGGGAIGPVLNLSLNKQKKKLFTKALQDGQGGDDDEDDDENEQEDESGGGGQNQQ